MKKDFLLEIGCENLPSGYIEGAVRQLEESFALAMRTERISYDSIYLAATPNRLVLEVKGLATVQDSAEEIVTGPPVSVALDPDGKYTKAAAGFASRQGVDLAALTRVDTGKGEYLAVIKKTESRGTEEILLATIPEIISNIRFPKVMKWDKSDFRFARPVRWILSFYGSRLFPFRIAGLVSSAGTRLSPYSTDMVRVAGIKEYFSLLKNNQIILDPLRRKKKVEALARKEAAGTGGRLVEDDDLCAMVANLVESPVVLAGRFDSSFLELPREVIVTALKSHQRYFSVEDEKGRLRPDFIAFADGAKRNKKEILKGYERVLQARLADAKFYFMEDSSEPLEKMAEKLERIVWLEGLGSLKEKAGRIAELSSYFIRFFPADIRPDEDDLRRAAMLAKADLASEMVKDGKEFTLLQGYIGREYAKVSGENDAVSDAIYEHYFPRFAGDVLPSTGTGLILSIADKLDTVCGCFILGLEPSGSQDPYALRRSSMSILRMMIEKRIDVDLGGAIKKSIALFAGPENIDASVFNGQIEGRIAELFEQRFVTILRGEGHDPDLVSAVLASPWKSPYAVFLMAGKLQEMRRDGRLSAFVLAMKRITNILPKELRKKADRKTAPAALEALSRGDEEKLGFSSLLFREEAEHLFLDSVTRSATALAAIESPEEYAGSFDILEELVPGINAYFDAVLVNCDDNAIKDNRISFLGALHNAFGIFCYYSEIAGE
ncbi:MAG: glycine--tRNA ligase subunit beta [Candidatus Krumholzibacteriota bacterium]|nr:glycine--tRNA ligase subunit beta [Candidatus Krumholzibacteriota bacterium]